MSDSKYPLTKALGLTVKGDGVEEWAKVDAEELEKKLREAPAVYGTEGSFRDESYWCMYGRTNPNKSDTHTARLLCVQPIVRDTAESLLRELVEDTEHGRPFALIRYIERARALLEEK